MIQQPSQPILQMWSFFKAIFPTCFTLLSLIYKRNFIFNDSVQIQQFVIGLFKFAQDAVTFKGHLRDFLVTLKEYSAEENAELWLEEKEQMLQEKNETEFEAALKIPGMIKPSQLYFLFINII